MTEIASIKIKLSSRELEFSLEEAIELHKELHKLFGVAQPQPLVVKEYVPYPVFPPAVIPPPPPKQLELEKPFVTCESTGYLK